MNIEETIKELEGVEQFDMFGKKQDVYLAAYTYVTKNDELIINDETINYIEVLLIKEYLNNKQIKQFRKYKLNKIQYIKEKYCNEKKEK